MQTATSATSLAMANLRRYPLISSLPRGRTSESEREREEAIVAARECVTDNKYLVDIATMSATELGAHRHCPFVRN